MRETDLFHPLKTYLEGQGYKVSSEVKGCDIVARKEDELIIVEMKTRFSLALVLQGVKRKELTDSVYLCAPVPPGKRVLPNLAKIRLLLRRLGIGLIQVRFLKTRTVVEVLLHPENSPPVRRHKRRNALIREIDGRYAELDIGGSPSSGPRMTAYRQEAIKIARFLSASGTLPPRKLKELGAGEKTQRILNSNYYGWFIREGRGLYSLSPEGLEALQGFPEVPANPGKSG